MQTHHIFQILGPKYGQKTRAHWSVVPASRLVVFVHGFGGSPEATWTDFPSLLPKRTQPPPFDYVFFGYDGVTQQATSSGSQFLGFLDAFLRDPAALINATIPSLDKRPTFAYDRVVIAAHSLGAVVSRRALLDAHGLQSQGWSAPWLGSVRLVLFAPAHSGAYAAKLASEALTDQPWYLGKLGGLAVAYNLPLLQDLQENSQVLRQLADDTAAVVAELAPSPAPDYVKARRILRGADDKVVINVRFGVDPVVPPQDVLPTGHLGVCKPKRVDHAALAAIWSEL